MRFSFMQPLADCFIASFSALSSTAVFPCLFSDLAIDKVGVRRYNLKKCNDGTMLDAERFREPAAGESRYGSILSSLLPEQTS